jgi:aryl-alcohol dehydrogenase-like predicted oxidoreductase
VLRKHAQRSTNLLPENEVEMAHENAEPALMLAETEVPRIGLGTNRLTNTPEHIAFLKETVAAGVMHVDTGHSYTSGESEETIGATLSPFAERVVVATKGGYRAGEGRAQVLGARIEQSLRRLQTDTIALYYLHRVDPETRLEESLRTIKEYRDSGKIRHVGLPEVGIEQIERAREVVPIAAVQNHYNLSERRWEKVVDYRAREGIVFVPFFPLRGAGGRPLAEIARRNDATPTQITLAWLLQRSPTMLPIPGTLSLDHLKQNLDALDIELSDADFDALS